MADRHYDVIIAGGGISGTMAAVAAAREGCRTLLIERYGALGGMATMGLVQPITTWGINGQYVIGGTGRKILEDVAGYSPSAATPMSCYGPACDAEYLKLVLQRYALRHGVDLLYHSWVMGIERDGDTIAAVRVLSKAGERRIGARVFVDATGDGDIAAFAEVPVDYGSQGITLMMVISGIKRERCPDSGEMAAIWKKYRPNYRDMAMFRHPREDSAYFNMTEVEGLDGLDPEDTTRAMIECREQAWKILDIFREHVPGYENAYIEQTAPALGVRETRRIIGRYVLTGEDVLAGRNFADAAARACCPVDIHGSENEGRGEYYWLERSYAIPYRSLTAAEIANLVVAGRCISADRTAHSSLRRMAPGFAIGEAAGVAAALAVPAGDVRGISVAGLQEALLSYGAILQPEE